jgi:hypothetical protein
VADYISHALSRAAAKRIAAAAATRSASGGADGAAAGSDAAAWALAAALAAACEDAAAQLRADPAINRQVTVSGCTLCVTLVTPSHLVTGALRDAGTRCDAV